MTGGIGPNTGRFLAMMLLGFAAGPVAEGKRS